MSSFGLIRGFRSSDSTAQPIRLDKATNTLQTIDYAHHEIHSGSSFGISVYDDTANTGDTLSVYIKTIAKSTTEPYCHMLAKWSAGGAALFKIYEAPTITANTGTNGQIIYNRNRNSASASTCKDNATSPASARYGLNVTKTGDGTVIYTEYGGVGKTGGGGGRAEEEIVLNDDTAYLFELTAIGNGIALNIVLGWYEHTDIA